MVEIGPGKGKLHLIRNTGGDLGESSDKYDHGLFALDPYVISTRCNNGGYHNRNYSEVSINGGPPINGGAANSRFSNEPVHIYVIALFDGSKV